MTPLTNRMPPPGLRFPQLLASPLPRPPTVIGASSAPPPPRPPRPPPPPPPGPAPAPTAGPLPVGPHPVVSVLCHLRLRFLTVAVLTSFRLLKRLPLRSPEYERHSSVSGFTMSAGSRPPTCALGLSGPICTVCPVQPRSPGTRPLC